MYLSTQAAKPFAPFIIKVISRPVEITTAALRDGGFAKLEAALALNKFQNVVAAAPLLGADAECAPAGTPQAGDLTVCDVAFADAPVAAKESRCVNDSSVKAMSPQESSCNRLAGTARRVPGSVPAPAPDPWVNGLDPWSACLLFLNSFVSSLKVSTSHSSTAFLRFASICSVSAV